MDDVTEQDPGEAREERATRDAEQPTGESEQATGDGKPASTVKAGKKHGSFLRELPFLGAIALVLALVIKAFLVQAFYIPSPSMTNTLQVGDKVLVNKLVYRFRDIHRGEIVVFNGEDSFYDPSFNVAPPGNGVEKVRRTIGSLLGLGTPGEKDYIKRVIGLPGDTISCCDDRGRVVVNGESLDEPYLFEDDRMPFGPVTVPEGRIFVMGDHRGRSSDSRAHIGEPHKGTVPIDKVIGRAFLVIWPPKHVRGLGVPAELERSALPEQPWSVAALPPVLGLLGAAPVAALRHRLRSRR